MSRFLAAIAILLLAFPLGGCPSCNASNPNETVAEVRNPFAMRSRPVLEPEGFTLRQTETVRTRRMKLVPADEPVGTFGAECLPGAAPRTGYSVGFRFQEAEPCK